jgi:thiol-disulfide isomerase/thioredoxin
MKIEDNPKFWRGAKSSTTRKVVLTTAVLATSLGWFFREPIRARVLSAIVLSQDAPSPQMLDEAIQSAPDRAAAVLAAWNSGKILHREAAMRQAKSMLIDHPAWPAALRNMAREGASDPDANVREAALYIASRLGEDALMDAVSIQWTDPDPLIRLMAANRLQQLRAELGIPIAARLLDDDDPRVITTAAILIGRWSGSDFGIRLSDVLPETNPRTGLEDFSSSSIDAAKAAARQAKTWLSRRSQPVAEAPAKTTTAPSIPKTISAGDFQLREPDGRPVRFSDFRGKLVLINFWTTWCTACVGEMPYLIELQKRYGTNLVILGVSLDAVPDEEGHSGGREADEDNHANEKPASIEALRAKVARVAAQRGLNYPILLDEQNEVGARFNGGELPTTVIVDAEGRIRRRFVGPRSLPVFEAMLADARRPQ